MKSLYTTCGLIFHALNLFQPYDGKKEGKKRQGSKEMKCKSHRRLYAVSTPYHHCTEFQAFLVNNTSLTPCPCVLVLCGLDHSAP